MSSDADPLSDDAHKVLRELHVPLYYGKPEVPRSREFLAQVTQLPDRAVRAAVEELRTLGYPIYSDPTTPGYRYACNEQEVMALVERFERTGKKHLLTASRLRHRHSRHLPTDKPQQESLF